MRLTVDPAADSHQPASPVTGLGFRVEGQILQLFAVTTSSINMFDMHEQTPQKNVLDQIGTEGRCVAMSDNQVGLEGDVRFCIACLCTNLAVTSCICDTYIELYSRTLWLGDQRQFIFTRWMAGDLVGHSKETNSLLLGFVGIF